MKFIIFFSQCAVLKYNYIVTIKNNYYEQFTKIFKTDKGEVINIMMIVYMYKNYEGNYVVEMVGNNQTTVSAEEFEQIYKIFKVN